MIRDGRIPMTPAERGAVDALAGRRNVTSVTRRDPGESGPVLAHADGITFAIDGDGVVTVHDG